MADAKAMRVFATIVASMDEQNLKYKRDDENLRVDLTFTTDDLDVALRFFVDENRQLVRLLSFLPGHFPEDKRVEGAVATCIANHGMVDGSFDYDFSDGEIVFKLVNSYRDSEISTEVVAYMLRVALGMVDQYNDRFYDLARGKMTIKEFSDLEG